MTNLGFLVGTRVRVIFADNMTYCGVVETAEGNLVRLRDVESQKLGYLDKLKVSDQIINTTSTHFVRIEPIP